MYFAVLTNAVNTSVLFSSRFTSHQSLILPDALWFWWHRLISKSSTTNQRKSLFVESSLVIGCECFFFPCKYMVLSNNKYVDTWLEAYIPLLRSWNLEIFSFFMSFWEKNHVFLLCFAKHHNCSDVLTFSVITAY